LILTTEFEESVIINRSSTDKPENITKEFQMKAIALAALALPMVAAKELTQIFQSKFIRDVSDMKVKLVL
jgi:hypothetical protein